MKNASMETLYVCQWCVVFSNENSFHFCFLWLLEASFNFMKDRAVLKVRKVVVWKPMLSFLLPGTWQHTKWFGSFSVLGIWKIQIALPLWEKKDYPGSSLRSSIPPFTSTGRYEVKSMKFFTSDLQLKSFKSSKHSQTPLWTKSFSGRLVS